MLKFPYDIRGDYDPHGNMNGRHRRQELKSRAWINYGMTIDDFEPYDLLFVASKSMIGLGIRIFSSTDGRLAWLNHVGQVIPWTPLLLELWGVECPPSGLVVSEANYPVHCYTPVEQYLFEQNKGHCRLTLMTLSDAIWASERQHDEACFACLDYHVSLGPKKYDAVGGLGPMLIISLFRNLTPLMWGKEYIRIPQEDERVVFICSEEVDLGWRPGQEMTGIDFFWSTLSTLIPSPQDEYESKWTVFKTGWKFVYKSSSEYVEFLRRYYNERSKRHDYNVQ